MDAETRSPRSKITVRIWTPIVTALVERTDAACLRRDALVSRTLRIELPRIRSEIPYKNSDSARRYIQSSLRSLFEREPGATQMTLALDTDVARELESVCEGLNVPRESLLNRLLLLLAAPGDVLDSFFMGLAPLSPEGRQPEWSGVDAELLPWPRPLRSLPRDASLTRIYDVRTLTAELTRRDSESCDFDQALSPLGRAAWVVSDPLRWYRLMLETRIDQTVEHFRAAGNHKVADAIERESFTRTPFGKPLEGLQELDGLSCYMPDAWVDEYTRPLTSVAAAISAPPTPPSSEH